MTNLHGYDECLSDVILYYNGTHLPADLPDKFKCSEGFKNVSVNEDPNEVTYPAICGGDTDVCLEFTKGVNNVLEDKIRL